MVLLLRILRMAAQNIYRNGLTSIVAVLVITLLFVIFNGILFANAFQKTALNVVNSRLDVALNFTQNVEANQVAVIESDVRATFPEIRDVKYVSSDDAFSSFVKNFGKNNRQLSTWLQNNTKTSPLPATLIISADATLHEEIISFLEASRYGGLFNLDKPATGQLAIQTADKIIALDQTLSRISFVATLAFIILAILIIVAVLRLAIFARGMEIGIMRLVGATRQFIRLPFILEGIFFGFAASIIGAITFFFILSRFDLAHLTNSAYGGVGEMLVTTVRGFSDSFALTLSWQILAAIAIGTLASLIATRRYLSSHEVIFS